MVTNQSTWNIVLLGRHQPISLQIRKYTEILSDIPKWQILKICGHSKKSKMLTWFDMTSTIILCGFNKIQILTDSSLNITLKVLKLGGLIIFFFLQETTFFLSNSAEQTFFFTHTKKNKKNHTPNLKYQVSKFWSAPYESDLHCK